ncbi:hypothetical protein [Streptomyces sp. NBC_01304]|uniref:hypothetical protein n=1 Tax=Streptomyces sp. NBC_01304 TaxID=2903818 RepID=UPI002E134B3C|nr:hypothetical protein OG430_19085 [Streptomyces sp. NBC_01304]
MKRRRVLAVVLAVAFAAGCGSGKGGEDRSGPPDGARSSVEAYVKALNARDVEALLAVGGTPDEAWSRKQAGRVLSGKGGRGLTVEDVSLTYDRMGIFLADAKLVAKDKDGGAVRENLELAHEGKWTVILFEHPADPGKPTSGTSRT